jgi:hypothetical protein
MAPVTKDRYVSSPCDAHPQLFIVTTSFGRLNKATRKLIRSHVMRGKNSSKDAENKMVYGTWINRLVSDQPVALRKTEESELWLSQPRSLCPDLETFTYADQIKPYALDLIFKCKLSLLTKPMSCIAQAFSLGPSLPHMRRCLPH